ncbi:MAG: RNA polymerase sigma factor [Ferruginibacter sp.]
MNTTNTTPGNDAVFTAIVERCQGMVFNTVLSIVQNNEDAEDVTQEVFIEVYENIGEFRQEAQLKTWVYRIAVNKALDWEKRKKRQKHGGLLKRIFSVKEEDEPMSFEHPGAQLDNKEKTTVLFSALKKLPEKQQVAFTLHKIEGLPYSEVANIMETTVNAVESLMVRAKSGLKKILENYYLQQNG